MNAKKGHFTRNRNSISKKKRRYEMKFTLAQNNLYITVYCLMFTEVVALTHKRGDRGNAKSFKIIIIIYFYYDW